MTAALRTPWWWPGSTISFVSAYVRAVDAGRTAWDLAACLGAPTAADLRNAVLALRRQGYDLPTPRPPLPPEPEPKPEPDWLAVLRREADASSMSKVGRRIGFAGSTVSRVLRGQETDPQCLRVSISVRHVLIEGKLLADVPDTARPPRAGLRPNPKAPQLGTTKRLCLKCRQPFASWGAGNRLCSPCRSSNLAESGYGGIF